MQKHLCSYSHTLTYIRVYVWIYVDQLWDVNMNSIKTHNIQNQYLGI